MQKTALKYNDESDRALGLAGMAVAITVWDGEDQMVAVNLDSAPGAGLELTPDFFFAGNPRLSARLAWRQMLKQLELASAMLVSNAMCRSYVGQKRALSSQAASMLRAMVHDEAVNVCSLEEDEIEALYGRVSDTCTRLFTHQAVQNLAERLAADMRQRRRMTAAEILDILEPLTR